MVPITILKVIQMSSKPNNPISRHRSDYDLVRLHAGEFFPSRWLTEGEMYRSTFDLPPTPAIMIAYIELLIISKGLFIWQGMVDDLNEIAKVNLTRQDIQEAKQQWLAHPEIFEDAMPSLTEFAHNYVSYLRHTKKQLTQEEANTLYDLISYNSTLPDLEEIES